MILLGKLCGPAKGRASKGTLLGCGVKEMRRPKFKTQISRSVDAAEVYQTHLLSQCIRQSWLEFHPTDLETSLHGTRWWCCHRL